MIIYAIKYKANNNIFCTYCVGGGVAHLTRQWLCEDQQWLVTSQCHTLLHCHGQNITYCHDTSHLIMVIMAKNIINGSIVALLEQPIENTIIINWTTNGCWFNVFNFVNTHPPFMRLNLVYANLNIFIPVSVAKIYHFNSRPNINTSGRVHSTLKIQLIVCFEVIW